nr:hypothetical protein [Tanacetum cinerariifolium]
MNQKFDFSGEFDQKTWRIVDSENCETSNCSFPPPLLVDLMHNSTIQCFLHVELYEEEQWGSFCLGSCFQTSERMRHREVVIGNFVHLGNRQLARHSVSYLREMQDQDMVRLEWFMNMVRESYYRVLRKRWFISMVTTV